MIKRYFSSKYCWCISKSFKASGINCEFLYKLLVSTDIYGTEMFKILIISTQWKTIFDEKHQIIVWLSTYSNIVRQKTPVWHEPKVETSSNLLLNFNEFCFWSNKNRQQVNSRDLKMTWTILLVCLCYFIFVMPMSVLNMIDPDADYVDFHLVRFFVVPTIPNAPQFRKWMHQQEVAIPCKLQVIVRSMKGKAKLRKT